MLDRVMTWRFAVLVGVGLVDAAVVMIPLVPVALLVAVLLAPAWLRLVARFLDALPSRSRAGPMPRIGGSAG